MKKTILLSVAFVSLMILMPFANASASDATDNLNTTSEKGIVFEEYSLDTFNFSTRAAPKSIPSKGTIIFNASDWAAGPPKVRNHKAKQHGYWYYGKLYLKSYKSVGGTYHASYAGTLYRK